METAEEIKLLIAGREIRDSLAILAAKFADKVLFSTSFSNEDQVITHLIFSNNISIGVFTLDTGRMFAETYSVWESTLQKYDKPITAYYPQTEAVQRLVNAKGPLSFYESVENRQECCHIRKVEPLKRALRGKELWITGIRAEQSASRQSLAQVEWDAGNKIFKYHPILNWTTEEVNVFIRQNNVPCNPLYDKGFVSIGCAPCTRAVKQGNDLRAGRWWWENTDKKECGLHTSG